MMVTLEARKTNLLGQIEKLKREIEVLKWLEDKELALYRRTASVKYYSLDWLQRNPSN